MIVREYINFERGIDPKQAMEIGMKSKIEKWLEEYFHNVSNATRESSFTINEDLTIDIDGFFACRWEGNFPDFIQFNEIRGDFMIQGFTGQWNTVKTSLRGCPQKVYGDFDCCRNDLKNLIGGPEYVQGYYVASLNPNIQSLEGLAKYIGKSFSCNNKSNLTIKDIPGGTKIKGGINISHWGGNW